MQQTNFNREWLKNVFFFSTITLIIIQITFQALLNVVDLLTEAQSCS